STVQKNACQLKHISNGNFSPFVYQWFFCRTAEQNQSKVPALFPRNAHERKCKALGNRVLITHAAGLIQAKNDRSLPKLISSSRVKLKRLAFSETSKKIKFRDGAGEGSKLRWKQFFHLVAHGDPAAVDGFPMFGTLLLAGDQLQTAGPLGDFFEFGIVRQLFGQCQLVPKRHFLQLCVTTSSFNAAQE